MSGSTPEKREYLVGGELDPVLWEAWLKHLVHMGLTAQQTYPEILGDIPEAFDIEPDSPSPLLDRWDFVEIAERNDATNTVVGLAWNTLTRLYSYKHNPGNLSTAAWFRADLYADVPLVFTNVPPSDIKPHSYASRLSGLRLDSLQSFLHMLDEKLKSAGPNALIDDIIGFNIGPTTLNFLRLVAAGGESDSPLDTGAEEHDDVAEDPEEDLDVAAPELVIESPAEIEAPNLADEVDDTGTIDNAIGELRPYRSSRSSGPNLGVGTNGNSNSGNRETIIKGMFGMVHFPAEDYAYPRRRQTVIRIENIDDLNRRSAQIAERYKMQLNHLAIAVDGRPVINGGIRFEGPISTEVLNMLLATYLVLPYSLDQAHSLYDCPIVSDKGHLPHKQEALHRYIVELSHQGIVTYDIDKRTGLALKPIFILDRRSRATHQ